MHKVTSNFVPWRVRGNDKIELLSPIKAGVVSRYRKTGGWLSQPLPLKSQMIYQFHNLRALMRLIQSLFIFLVLIGVNRLVKSIFLVVWIVCEIAPFWHGTGPNIGSHSLNQWSNEWNTAVMRKMVGFWSNVLIEYE